MINVINNTNRNFFCFKNIFRFINFILDYDTIIIEEFSFIYFIAPISFTNNHNDFPGKNVKN